MQRSTSPLSLSSVLTTAGLFAVAAFGCAGGSNGGGTGTGGGTGPGSGGHIGNPGSGGFIVTGSGGAGPGSGGSIVTGTGGGGPGTGGRTGTGGGGPGTGGAVVTGTGGAGGSTRPVACAPASADVISDFEEGNGSLIRQGTPVRTGWWYTYFPNPTNAIPPVMPAGTSQTPPRSDGPIAVAVDPAATNPACNKALHVTGSGFTGMIGTVAINYSGFGASFLPMPAPSQVKTPYDLTPYTGISFKIKAGSGTPPAVYLEMLTKDSQPASSGGVATVLTVDLNNNRGQIIAPPWTANSILPTWQTVYVPFGSLIPRWLPAVGSGMACPAAGAGVPRCEAPKFNPANVLGFQFSMYADPGFPRPAGSTLGTYDLWVDDVTLVRNDATLLPTLPGFPNDAAPGGTCSKPTQANGKFLVGPYNTWKSRFVVADGANLKVIRPESNNDTVSEGIAYGMLIGVYMNDQALFNGLWGYWKSHGDGSAPDGPLMIWNNTGGSGTATDADEDAAFAMLEASKRWVGGTDGTTSYASLALNLMHSVLAHDMSGSFIKAGSNYGSPTASGAAGTNTNPSYFAPAYYTEFAKADTINASAWNGLASGAYALLASIGPTSSVNGLYAAWCSNGCTNIATNPMSQNSATDNLYQYDSHRIPWRIGLDFCWHGTAAAGTYLKTKIIPFFANNANAGLNGISRISDMYTPGNGNAASAVVNSASIIGTAGVGAMSDGTTFRTFLDSSYQLVFDVLNRGPVLANLGDGTMSAYSYYNATVGMLTLLSMTGNLRPL